MKQVSIFLLLLSSLVAAAQQYERPYVVHLESRPTDVTLLAGDIWRNGDTLYFKNSSSNVNLTSSGSPLSTKGDVYVYGTTNARLPVGTDTYVLTADSTQPLGLKWAAAPASGLYTAPNNSVFAQGAQTVSGNCGFLVNTSNHIAPNCNLDLGTLDMSAASVTTAFLPPAAAGAAPITTGVVAYDTTSKRLVSGDGAVTKTYYVPGDALGTPASATLTNATGLPLTGLATQAANTVVMNATGGVASPTAVAINDCQGTGKALTYNQTTHAWGCNTISGGGNIVFAAPGNHATTGINSTKFFSVGVQGTCSANWQCQWIVPVACTAQKLYASTNTAQGAAGSLTISLEKNLSGTNSVVIITIAAGTAAGTFSDTIDTLAVAAGDTLDFRVVNNDATNDSAQINSIAVACQ